MNSVFRLTMSLVLLSLLISCGHRKPPTGGKADTEQPTVVTITPEPYSDINQGIIEITFSKPIDRTSVYSSDRGLYIYPLIGEKRFRWRDNTLRIEINEPLIEETNYYLSLTQTIRDLRNNRLDKDYLFIFHTGKLTNHRIGGIIMTEKEEDAGKEVIVNVLAPDSVMIFQKRTTGSNLNIQYLNNQPHLLRAYIDKNNNTRYDHGKEPFFEAFVPAGSYSEVNPYLEYFDETIPELMSVSSHYLNLIVINFNKAVSQLESINLVSKDSLEHKPDIIDYDFIGDKLEIVTSPLDSLRYEISLTGTADAKGNRAELLTGEFRASRNKEETALHIEDSSPRNGSVVETLKPALRVVFSKYVLKQDIVFKLTDTMTGRTIPAFIHRVDSRNYVIVPEDELVGRQTYLLTVSATTTDAFGNKLNEPLSLNFLPILNR